MILDSTIEPPRRGCVPWNLETVGQRSRRKVRNKGEKRRYMASVLQKGHQGRQQRKGTWKDTCAARNPHRSKVNPGPAAHLERNNSAERRRRSGVILWRRRKRFRRRAEEEVCLWFACQLEPQNDRNAIEVRVVRSATWQGQAEHSDEHSLRRTDSS